MPVNSLVKLWIAYYVWAIASYTTCEEGNKTYEIGGASSDYNLHPHIVKKDLPQCSLFKKVTPTVHHSYKSRVLITPNIHSYFATFNLKAGKNQNFTATPMASSLLTTLLIAIATAQVALAIYYPTCGAPHRPDNGGYNPINDKYTVGSKINFFCKTGYRLHGSSSTICKHKLKKSYWSHESPVCKRKL